MRVWEVRKAVLRECVVVGVDIVAVGEGRREREGEVGDACTGVSEG